MLPHPSAEWEDAPQKCMFCHCHSVMCAENSVSHDNEKFQSALEDTTLYNSHSETKVFITSGT